MNAPTPADAPPTRRRRLAPLIAVPVALVMVLLVKVKFEPPLKVQEAPLNATALPTVRERLRGENAQAS